MIELKQLQKIYHPREPNQIIALAGIDMFIQSGDFLVVVGANGSGKSTLLNAIAGNILPTSGEIWIDKLDVSRLPDYERSKWIARVFQNPLSGTAPELSILDNFRLAALRTTKKKLFRGINPAFKQRVKDQIATLGMGLENKIDQPIGTLSGGQRQALTLLMSVMDDVKILLLDEPTAALDPRSAEVVIDTASRLIATYQLTAVMVTHNLKDAFLYGNRLVLMKEGKIEKDLNSDQKKAILQTDLYNWFM